MFHKETHIQKTVQRLDFRKQIYIFIYSLSNLPLMRIITVIPPFIKLTSSNLHAETMPNSIGCHDPVHHILLLLQVVQMQRSWLSESSINFRYGVFSRVPPYYVWFDSAHYTDFRIPVNSFFQISTIFFYRFYLNIQIGITFWYFSKHICMNPSHL